MRHVWFLEVAGFVASLGVLTGCLAPRTPADATGLGSQAGGSTSNGGTTGGGQTTSDTLNVSGLQRSYRLHVPDLYDGSQAALVLVFHGSGGSGENIEAWSGFDAVSDQAGFIVAYPNGVNHEWNVVAGVGNSAVDDVGFVRALIDQLSTTFVIDPARVFASGMSMGGAFCQRLGLELSDQIAAIGPVAGPLAPALASESPARVPVSVVAMQGTADTVVPFDGGIVRQQSSAEVLGAEAMAQFWAGLDQCPTTAVTELLPDTDPNDGTRVQQQTYGPGLDGADVVLYVIEGGGHTWPGIDETQFPQHGKPVTHDIRAARVIWDFFQKHPKP